MDRHGKGGGNGKKPNEEPLLRLVKSPDGFAKEQGALELQKKEYGIPRDPFKAWFELRNTVFNSSELLSGDSRAKKDMQIAIDGFNYIYAIPDAVNNLQQHEIERFENSEYILILTGHFSTTDKSFVGCEIKLIEKMSYQHIQEQRIESVQEWKKILTDVENTEKKGYTREEYTALQNAINAFNKRFVSPHPLLHMPGVHETASRVFNLSPIKIDGHDTLQLIYTEKVNRYAVHFFITVRLSSKPKEITLAPVPPDIHVQNVPVLENQSLSLFTKLQEWIQKMIRHLPFIK